LQQNDAKIQEAGAELIAISSETIDMTKWIVKHNGIKYLVLADTKLKAIRGYNVRDPNNARIARPATYVLNVDGTVAWISLDPEKTRVPTETIIAQINRL
jgi:peroxiredoxin